MRLLLDENLSQRVCPFLTAAGHDAVHVDAVGLAGTEDVDIARWARSHQRVVVTCDHDFVQLLFAEGGVAPSLILTRSVDTLPSDQLAELLLAALSPELQELLDAGAIATLNHDRVRVRPLPLSKDH